MTLHCMRRTKTAAPFSRGIAAVRDARGQSSRRFRPSRRRPSMLTFAHRKSTRRPLLRWTTNGLCAPRSGWRTTKPRSGDPARHGGAQHVQSPDAGSFNPDRCVAAPSRTPAGQGRSPCHSDQRRDAGRLPGVSSTGRTGARSFPAEASPSGPGRLPSMGPPAGGGAPRRGVRAQTGRSFSAGPGPASSPTDSGPGFGTGPRRASGTVARAPNGPTTRPSPASCNGVWGRSGSRLMKSPNGQLT